MAAHYDTERKLLIALKKGNLAAFEILLTQYERQIFGYVFRLVNSRPDAEDLTQDIFIKVYEKRRMIDPERNFKSWLYTVATHTVYDWLRKKRRLPEIAAVEEAENLSETFEPIPAYYSLEDTLAILPPQQQTVLLLFYREDHSYQEIADILNLPLGTVKTYLYRAKKSLRQSLSIDNER